MATRIGAWRTAGTPAHQSLSTAIRLAILDGRISLEQQLPSERSFALALGVSRTTVTRAYRNLSEQGFLHSEERHKPRVRIPLAHQDPSETSTPGDVIDLATASPQAPERHIHAAYAHALDRLPAYLGQTGYDRSGLPALRSAVARWFTARGLETGPEQIFITHGAQHALSLVARTLLGRHGSVALEHPTYPNALQLFSQLGARITALPPVRASDDLQAWQNTLQHVDLTYLVADFHNPTGESIPAENRPALRTRNLMVVDETMVALGLNGSPLTETPPMACIHPKAITIGSASKCFWGGLRVGWLRASEAVVTQLAQRRPITDLGNSVLDQLAVADLLDAGRSIDVEASLRRTERCEHLRRMLLGSSLDIRSLTQPTGGLSLWMQLEEPVTAAMSVRASEFGLSLSAGPRFSPSGGFQRHLRIPFTLPAEDMEMAIDRLVDLRSAVQAMPLAP